MENTNIQDYRSLFGALDFKKGDEARSVYSPAAYLADLLQLMDDEFTDTDIMDISGESKNILSGRRSDIRQLLLDAENTYDLIPHLEIVNEVLENKIGGKDTHEENTEEVYKNVLPNTQYPFNTPFNLSEEEVKIYLKYLGISAEELHKLFATNAQLDDEIIAREYLMLSPEDWDFIATFISNTADIHPLYGYSGNNFITDMSTVATFIKATGLTGAEVRALVYQNLSEEEKEQGVQNKFLVNKFRNNYYAFLTKDEEHIQQNNNGTIGELEYWWFQYVRRFSSLAKKLKFSFTDLDIILRLEPEKAGLDEVSLKLVASVKNLHEATKAPIDEVVALVGSMNEIGHGEDDLPQDLFSRTFNNKYVEQDNKYIVPGNGILPHQYADKKDAFGNSESTYSAMAYVDDLFAGDNYYFRKRVTHALGISERDLEKIIQRLDDKNVDNTLWMTASEQNHLLNFLYRFVKLSEVLDISHEEVFTLWDLLEQDPSVLSFNQHSTFLNHLPSTQDCYDIFLEGNVNDRLWLIQSLHSLVKWMMTYDFSADLLWYIATGKLRSEKAEIAATELSISQLNGMQKAFKTLMPGPALFQAGTFDARSAEVIYQYLQKEHHGKCDHTRKLLKKDKEHAQKVAEKAVSALAKVTDVDFRGLGLEEALVEKIHRNLVYLDYASTDGMLDVARFPSTREEFRLETDFSHYLEEVFAIIHRLYLNAKKNVPVEDEVMFSIYLSDLRKLPLSENTLQELYDNLIFNHYIDEEGTVKFNNFFGSSDNWQYFDVNTHLQEHASEVYDLLHLQWQQFHTAQAKITAGTFEELGLTEIELEDLLENLRFNGYIDVHGYTKDKVQWLTEDAESFRLALQFYPKRKKILSLAQARLKAVQKEHLTIKKEKLSEIADLIISKWAFEDLQGKYLNGQELLFEARTFFSDVENKSKLVLGYYFEEAAGVAVFQRMQSIIQTAEKYQFVDSLLVDMKFYPHEIEELMILLKNMGMLTYSHHIPVDKIAYFLESNNAIDFSLQGFEDFNKEIFFMLQTIAKATAAAHQQIVDAITGLAEKQDMVLWEQLQGIFGIDKDSLKIISEVLWEGEDHKKAWLLPVMKQVNVLGELTALPKDKAFNTAFQRVRQYSVLANKLRLGAKETAIAFQEQDLAAKFPETLELPKRTQLKIDNHEIVISESGHAHIYFGSIPVNEFGKVVFKTDNEELVIEADGSISLTDTEIEALGTVKEVVTDSGVFPIQDFGKIIFIAKHSSKLIIAEDGSVEIDYYGINKQLVNIVTVTQAKAVVNGYSAKVGNKILDSTNAIVSALATRILVMDVILEDELYTYLFVAGFYWTYRKSDYKLVDRYGLQVDNPRAEDQMDEEEKDIIRLLRDEDTLRKMVKEDPLRHLFEKEGMIHVDAAFKDEMGHTYIVSGTHYFLRMKDSETWMKMENPFGAVDNDFKSTTAIEAAYKDAQGRLYLFADGLYVRYSDGYDYIDKGYPKSIKEDWKQEGVEVHWPAIFGDKVDAAFEGTDGETYFFHEQQFVSTKDEVVRDVKQHWGKLKHNFKDIDQIDAAFTHEGATYIIAGEEVVKYTDSLENEGIQVAEGFPMSIADYLPDLPLEFARGVDAAFEGTNGQIHFFKEEYTVSFELEEDADSKSGVRIKGDPELEKIEASWGQVVNNLQDTGQIDAAMIGLDGYTYLFSGTQYFRYKTGNYAQVDEGFPRSIAEDWEGLQQIDAAFVLDGKTYVFGEKAGKQIYIRYSTKDYSQMDEEDQDEEGYITPVGNLLDVEEVKEFPTDQNDDFWSLPKSLIDGGFTKVDAVLNAHDGKTYLFSGDKVVESDYIHRWWSEPKTLQEQWPGLTFTHIDAALAGKDGKTYLFSGDEYVRFSDKEACHMDHGYPRKTGKYWGELKNNIIENCKIDAAVVLESRAYDEDAAGDDIRKVNTHTYLFSGDQYFRYVGNQYIEVESGYPKPLAHLMYEPRFKALEEKPTQIDALLADFRNVYIFDGNHCHVISDQTEVVYLNEAAPQDYTTDTTFDYPRIVYGKHDFSNTQTVLIEKGSVYALESNVWKRFSALEGNEFIKKDQTPEVINDAPDTFKTNVDAILQGTDGNTYFFKEEKCYNLLLATEYNIDNQWGKPENPIYENGRIDAGFVGRDGKTYLFGGTHYYVYTGQSYLGVHLETSPKRIAHDWGGIMQVSFAYVVEDRTYLIEKADDSGNFKYVVYKTDDYLLEQPEMHYGDISFWGIPHAQQQAGFDEFDTVFQQGDNLIFIKDRHFIRYHLLEQNWSYPKELSLLFPDIHFNKTTFENIQTAFRGIDGKMYFFDEDCFKVATNNNDGTYSYSNVEEVSHHWGLLSNPLHNGIKATLVHQGITYLFSTDHYARYSDTMYDVVDEGYPKQIAECLHEEAPFKHLGKELKYALEAGGQIKGIVVNPRNTYVFISGDLYIGSSTAFDTFALARLSNTDNTFDLYSKVDAAFVRDGKTYLLAGNQYIRYSGANYKHIDLGYPKLIMEDLLDDLGITGKLPADYKYGIDAAYTDETDKLTIFRGEHYWTSDSLTEKPIQGQWGQSQNNFEVGGTIDAAYIDAGGRLYVFKGDQFLRYSEISRLYESCDDDAEVPMYADAMYPMHIREHEAHLPLSFTTDLDGTFMFEGKLYFVKGNEYVMHHPAMMGCDEQFYPQTFTYRWGDWSDYLLMDIYLLARFMELNERFVGTNETLTSLLYARDGYTKEPYWELAEIFGFDKEEVRWAKRQNMFLSDSHTNAMEHDFDLESIVRLYDILSTAQRLKVKASELHEVVWKELYDKPRTFDTAKAAAEGIYQMLGSMDYNDNYNALFDEVDRALHTTKRDVLVPYTIATDDDVNDTRDLYEKLLVDVQMENEASTSRIKEAAMAIQLFFHRYFLNLENADLKGDHDDEKREALKEQWEWMSNYRVWEANRKVFLYPENYIRPELRDEDMKTPAFETLEQDLTQGEITDEAVQRVYKKYLDEFTEVSRLKIAGGYIYDEINENDPSKANRKLVLLGRTKSDPLRYYYRFGDFLGGAASADSWGSWKPLNITIESKKVYPVYAFNKVFVFWPKIETVAGNNLSAKIDNSEDIVDISSESSVLYTVKIYFSYYDLNENWIQPQELKTVFEKPIEKSVLEDYLKSVEDGSTVDDLYKGVKISDFDLSGFTYQNDILLSQEEIAGVNLSVEYANTLDNSDHDNIVITCQYSTVRFKEALIKDDPNQLLLKNSNKVTRSFILTPELYTEVVANPIAFGNTGKETFERLFDEGEIENENVVALNTTSNSLDAPWFAYDHKGGSFLCKPNVPLLNNDAIADTLLDIDAAFTWNNKIYYFDGSEYYTSSNANKQNISGVWGVGTVPAQPFRRVETAFNWQGIYIMDDEHCTIINTDFTPKVNPVIINNDLHAVLANMSLNGINLTDDLKNLKIIAAYEYLLEGIENDVYNQDPDNNDYKYPVRFHFHVVNVDDQRSIFIVDKNRVTNIWSLIAPTDTTDMTFLLDESRVNGRDWTAACSLAISIPDEPGETIRKIEHYQIGFFDNTMQVVTQESKNVTGEEFSTPQLYTFSETGTHSINLPKEITATVVNGNEIYIFSGDEYIVIPEQADFKPETIVNAIKAWSGSVKVSNNHWIKQEESLSSFDAVDATYVDDNKLFVIRDHKYAVYPLTNGQDVSIGNTEVKLLDSKADKIDAAFVLNNKAYLFEEDHFYTSDSGSEPDNLNTSQPIKGNWINLPIQFASDVDASLSDGVDLTFYKGDKSITYNIDGTDDTKPKLYKTEEINYEIIRLTSSTAKYFSTQLFSHGIEGLLQLQTQQINEEPAFSTTEKNATTIKVNPMHVDINSLPISTNIDYNSANGMYYWEVFFHAPFLIAMSLNTDQKFEEAKEWYEHIYDPTAARYFWKFLPFQAVDVDALIEPAKQLVPQLSISNTFTEADRTDLEEKMNAISTELKKYDDEFLGNSTADDISALSAYLTSMSNDFASAFAKVQELINEQTDGESPEQQLLEIMQLMVQLPDNYLAMQNTRAQINRYLNDPFDPHAIAVLRPIAYRKTIVMNYVDNLLDWGDMLFRQYTRESINEARMLYVLAYDLLGRKPENLGKRVLSDPQNFEHLAHNLDDDNYDFLFLLDLENNGEPQYDSLTFSGSEHDTLPTLNASVLNPYFHVPENTVFRDYWDRVEDRLFKIRHTLNITGEKQPLPLFQPPIDPMALVNAIAGGASLSSVLGMLHTGVPHYRFSYMLEKAKAYTDKVAQFGGDLLGAIEKKDAEGLEILRNKQEAMILALNTQIKEDQIKDAEAGIKNLEISKVGAEQQWKHYDSLINEGLLTEEEVQIGLMIGSTALMGVSAALKIGASVAHGIPQVSAGPFIMGTIVGGQQVGESLEKMSDSLQTIGDTLSTGGEVAGIYAQHKRSLEDWEMQRDMAKNEIDQIDQQILSAQIQKAIAQRELQIHDQEIDNNTSISNFMKDKFSNLELYNWMSSKLSGLFYQTYKMAHDIAKQAEKAFVFETGSKEANVQFIGGTYWDSQKKGLLSGESLGDDLAKMEKSYMEQDTRGMEITKNISLLELDPIAFIHLKTKGECMFRLTEELFDHDFPGHYNRQMKTISLAFDITEGKTVNATLTQLNNKLVMEPDIKAVKYLLEAKGEQPMTMRTDWKVNQQIALSYVDQYTENNGLFELRYDDARYLPFEGTGAVSLWKLELGGKKGDYNLDELLDVTVKIRYTAEQGGGAFANAVRGALKPYQATSFLDLGYSFPKQWNSWMQSSEPTMSIRFTREMFPNITGSKALGIYTRYEYTGDKTATVVLNDEVTLGNNKYLELSNLTIAKKGTPWTFTIKGDKSQIKNIELIVVYKAKV